MKMSSRKKLKYYRNICSIRNDQTFQFFVQHRIFLKKIIPGFIFSVFSAPIFAQSVDHAFQVSGFPFTVTDGNMFVNPNAKNGLFITNGATVNVYGSKKIITVQENSYKLSTNSVLNYYGSVSDEDIKAMVYGEESTTLNVSGNIFTKNNTVVAGKASVAGGVFSVNLKSSGVLESETGYIFSGDQSTPGFYMDVDNAGMITGRVSSTGGQIDLNNSGDWLHKRGDSILTNLTNSGSIKFRDDIRRMITVTGNYVGNHGVLDVWTNWNVDGSVNGQSDSDVLNILGNATGTTTVVASDGAILGDYTIEEADTGRVWSADVIKVGGTSSQNAFVGETRISGSALLPSMQQKDAHTWAWTVKVNTSPGALITPDSPNNYVPSTSAYIQMPHVNMEQGYATVATLHERRGNQPLQLSDDQSWSRLLGYHLNQDGKERFGFKSDYYGFQIGRDFNLNRDQLGGFSLNSAYIAYTRADTRFNDQFRADNGFVSSDKYAGKGDSDAWNLGLTLTRYAANHSYLDVVGQLSYYHNKYKSRDAKNGSQNGFGALLSAEVGRPFVLAGNPDYGSHWTVEPQGQLIYQYLNLDKMDVENTQIDQKDQHGLRGRVGVRLAYNMDSSSTDKQTNTFYGVVNVLNDFINPRSVKIGHDSLSENYGSTWAEVGAGVQIPVTKTSYLYADARYERNLDSAKREGYRGTVGVKFAW